MPTGTFQYQDEAERLSIEAAIAFVAEMRQLGLQKPDGGVIDACEALTLFKGQDFLRDTLAAAVQARVDDIEKKSNRSAATKPAARGGGRGRS